MTETKIVTLVIYVVVGLLLALWPVLVPSGISALLHSRRLHDFKGFSLGILLAIGRWRYASKVSLSLAEIMLVVGGIFLLLLVRAINSWKAGIVFALIAIVIGRMQGRRWGGTAIGAFAALMSAATIPYWRRDSALKFQVSFDNLVVFAALTCGMAFLLSRPEFEQWAGKSRRTNAVLWAVYGGVAIMLAFMTTSSMGSSPAQFLAAWQNWGVYVAASELLLSGARIFYDFPVQYGLGPTAMLAATCGTECWTGLYWLTGLSNVCYALLIGWIAVGSRPVSAVWQGVILLTCLVACFFYTAAPFDLTFTLVYPSAGGFRFLPAVILAAYLIKAERPKPVFGHLLWGIGALWSPESAFYCTVVWWPLYLLIRRQDVSLAKRLIRLPLAMLPLLTALAVLVVGSIGLYYAIYHTCPSAGIYLTYVLSPPGPLDIFARGVVWYLISVLAVGIAAALGAWPSRNDDKTFRHLFVCILLLFGASSYYVAGRSHENNVLNLMPFMVCLLAVSFKAARPPMAKVVAMTLLATVIAWAPTFNWDNLAKAAWFLNFKADAFLSSMSYEENPELPGPAADAGRALETIREKWGESAVVIDSLAVFSRHDWRDASWTALNDIASYTYVPDAERRKIILSAALRFRKPGWLVISRAFKDDSFRQDFDSAYNETMKIGFGSYYAVRMVPRLPPE